MKFLKLFNFFQSNCFNAWRTQSLLVYHTFSPFFKTFQLEYEIDLRVVQPSHGQERVEEWRMRSMQRTVQSK